MVSLCSPGRVFDANGAIGCEQWHRWTGFEPLNYFLYFVFGVGLVSPLRLSYLTLLDLLRLCRRYIGQILCALRSWLWNFRDQVHYCRVRHEGLPRLVDSDHKVHMSTPGYRVRLVSR